MNKLRAGVLIFFPIVVLSLMGGCETLGKGKRRQTTQEKVISSENASGEGAVVQETTVEDLPPPEPEKRFSDVPLPEGFSLDRSKSFVYEAGQIKAGFLTYTGRSSLEDIISFYKAEMLPYEWKLMSTLEFNGVTLYFEKTGWFCRVQVQSATFRKTKLLIAIGPKSSE